MSLTKHEIPFLCRICLIQSPNLLPMQSSLKGAFGIITILEALENLMSVIVMTEDKYPAGICTTCCQLLQKSYDFKTTFNNNQAVLMRCFEDFSKEDIPDKASVLLISEGGKYDLNDIAVVGQNEKPKDNFDGCLNNLGTEISAKFVNQSNEKQLENSSNDVDSVLVKSYTYDNCGDKTKPHKRKYQKCMEKFNHKVEKSQLCHICGYISRNSRIASYHRSTHQEHKYKCSKCNKFYKTNQLLQFHMNNHNKIRKELCTICGKTFNYKHALVYHIRSHKNEKKYKCRLCPKRFAMPFSLKRHMTDHNGERPHICSHCQKGFKSRGERLKHERIHTGERPFKCQYCEKVFSTKFNRDVHHISHPGNHECYYCRRTFIEVDFLRKHLKTKHQDEV